jgi:hypothetical protein
MTKLALTLKSTYSVRRIYGFPHKPHASTTNTAIISQKWLQRLLKRATATCGRNLWWLLLLLTHAVS